jgi:hypothetical protein
MVTNLKLLSIIAQMYGLLLIKSWQRTSIVIRKYYPLTDSFCLLFSGVGFIVLVGWKCSQGYQPGKLTKKWAINLRFSSGHVWIQRTCPSVSFNPKSLVNWRNMTSVGCGQFSREYWIHLTSDFRQRHNRLINGRQANWTALLLYIAGANLGHQKKVRIQTPDLKFLRFVTRNKLDYTDGIKKNEDITRCGVSTSKRQDELHNFGVEGWDS